MCPDLSPMSGGREPGASPIPASTLIPLRDGDQGLEVYLLRRSPGSAFMPGTYVFPGGTVDTEDRDTDFWMGHADLPPRVFRERLCRGMEEREALTHAVCAVRETFEEAGLLLAEGRGWREGLHGLQEARVRNRMPVGWLKGAILTNPWSLSLGALAPWSRWITPVERSRRFDTWFFAAFLDASVDCAPDGREVLQGLWVGPGEALAANDEGRIPLSPPALVTLHELLPFKDGPALRQALSLRTWGEARVPRLLVTGEGPLLLLPWDPEHGGPWTGGRTDRKIPHHPPGVPFSRLRLQGTVWLPLPPGG